MEQERMYAHTSRLIIAYLLNKALYWLSVALIFSASLLLCLHLLLCL